MSRREQQRSSVVNKIFNQWSQWLVDLGKQQHRWHKRHSPHFSSRLFCFAFDLCLSLSTASHQVCVLVFFWDSSAASLNLLIASLLPKCFWTALFLHPKSPKTTESDPFSSTSFPYLNPQLYWTLFLDLSASFFYFSAILPLLSSSVSHRCIWVSCCGCSRCRLAGRLWSSALWRRADSRRCRSRSPVCRRSNQWRAHLRWRVRWARRKTQLQAVKRTIVDTAWDRWEANTR